MALGKRKRERQLEAFVSASDLPQSPGHPSYRALNRLLAENDFDSFVEALCTPFCAGVMGRPSIPTGVFFRMTFVGYAIEYKIPLTVLHAARGLKSGDTIHPQFHVLWGRDDGRSCRFSVTDLTEPKGFNPAGEWDRAYHGPPGSVVVTCE